MEKLKQIQKRVNELGRENVPFLLITDFENKAPLLYKLDELESESIKISFPSFSTQKHNLESSKAEMLLEKKPITYSEYKCSFDMVMNEIRYGNSFLTNLTASTPISINASLERLFYFAEAKYKLLYKDEWLCFSPETFITIHENGRIQSNPMKGTIDASIPNAEKLILEDNKERAEHFTIVDLIRNDLSMVSTEVKVNRFRYIEKIKTNTKSLLQVSSEIEGVLARDYKSRLGDIIFTLLPAGSISGAPKQKTVESILTAETHTRGYYTGVAFLYNGATLDSCVLIRFIEKTPHGMMYKSGGGITINSNAEREYQEMIDKVYVPII